MLSFFIPGLSQLVQGRLLTAILCFCLTLAGYVCFIVPGLLMHLMVIVDAVSYDRRSLVKAVRQASQGDTRW
jgi:hypothetical protein